MTRLWLARFDIAGSPCIWLTLPHFLGQTSGVLITSDLREGLKCQVPDRLHPPEGTMAHLRVCRELGVNLIIGTTGFTEGKGRNQRRRARHRHRHGPSMSVGVNVVLKLLAQPPRPWKEGYDIEIIEAPPPQGRCSQRHGPENG